MSFEAANITNLSNRTEVIISNSEYSADQRNPNDKSENNKSTEVNASDKKEKLIARKP